VLAPFLVVAAKRKLDIAAWLDEAGLSRRSILDDTGMVTAGQVHRLVARAAELSGDPFFNWQVGWGTDYRKAPLFGQTVSRDLSLGDFLARLTAATGLATASRFELIVRGDYSHFSSYRLYQSEPAPHTDAYGAGALAALLRYYLNRYWTPAEITLELFNADLIPPGVGCRVVASATPSRLSVHFPTTWLPVKPRHKPMDAAQPSAHSGTTALIELLQEGLQAVLHDPGLTAEGAALLCNCSLREINTTLKSQGLTLARLIDTWRKDKALRLLDESDMEIAAVGIAVGYPDRTSFSRAFRRWTGTSPRAHRQSAGG
jgi:AraC-like DNA-binding protein